MPRPPEEPPEFGAIAPPSLPERARPPVPTPRAPQAPSPAPARRDREADEPGARSGDDRERGGGRRRSSRRRGGDRGAERAPADRDPGDGPARDAAPERPERPARRRRERGEDRPDDRPADRPTARPADDAPTRADAPAPEELAPAERPATVTAPDGRVVEWRGYKLLPFQIRAVQALREGRNVLVSAPTGAGKTLAAEYAVEDAVRRGGRVIYTSPIKALSSQKYRDFKAEPDVDVGIMTGDVTIHAHAQVLVMTTEILRNAIFENEELIRDVEYVVFDEVHYLDDRERGTVWEECLIFLPPNVRLICLSATISNFEELGHWLGEIREQEVEVVREDRRPVPLSHWMYTDRSGAFDPGRLEFNRRRAQKDLEQEREARGARRGGPRGSRRKRHYEGRRPRHERGVDAKGLLDELVDTNKLPALVFAFSRKDVERMAQGNARRDLLDADEKRRMRLLQEELLEVFQLDASMMDSELFAMARRGVSHHHAGMLPIHKEVVERMFTAGLLKLLFTTETFALGINMPARSVVFNSLRKFDGISFDWLRTRDYMQMAGRAGRQGIDDKGFVYCLLEPKDLVEAPLQRLFAGRPEEVTSRFRLSYSTILHLVERAGRERLFDAWEKSFAQYQARAKNKKARDRQRRDQRREVERRLDLLTELGYLEGDQVTARGKIARLLSGYELQVTELLFSGTLENLPAKALVMVFTALIFEERKRHGRTYVSPRHFGNVRRAVSGALGELCSVEARYGIEPPLKGADWGLTDAVLAWYGGASIEDLEETTDSPMGDVCRVMRMTIQLLRNTARAIDPTWDLRERLLEASNAVNRDEIDARRQLELG